MAARPRKTASRKSAKRKPARGARAPFEDWREGAEKLEALGKDTQKALEQGQLDRTREAFAAYRDAILLHLRREEDVAFPAAERLAPAQQGPIKSLRVAHIGIRGDLDQVKSHLDLGHAEAAAAVFAAYLESFGAHEVLEDQLIALLGKSRPSPGPGRRSR